MNFISLLSFVSGISLVSQDCSTLLTECHVLKQMADNATLYGVCLHVPEIVQRPPGIVGNSSPLPQSSGGCRFLVSAPRCYCLLTRTPFFELHYEMLNRFVLLQLPKLPH